MHHNRLIKCLTGKLLQRQLHILPYLPFSSADLAPAISQQLFESHYHDVHQEVVNELNVIEKTLHASVIRNDLEKTLLSLPRYQYLLTEHYNHNFMWEQLTNKKNFLSSQMAMILKNRFDSIESFKKRLVCTSNTIQGSGWVWFVLNADTSQLEVIATQNNDIPKKINPFYIPLLAIDCWEHAYYEQYQTARDQYIINLWDLFDWDKVEEKYTNAMLGFNQRQEWLNYMNF